MQNRFDLLDTDMMPIFMIIALDIFITMHFSINCSTVICSPAVIHAILREATSETYGPWVYFPSYKFPIYFILQYLSYYLYQSHFCKWPWRDWQPLYRVGCEVLICVCRYEVTRAWSPTGLIPWFSNWGKYLLYFAASPFPLQGKNQRKLKK